MQNKSKKLTSRLLSALLALACVLTLLPGVAVAAEDEGGKMVVDKTAKLEDDGTYTIELSALPCSFSFRNSSRISATP